MLIASLCFCGERADAATHQKCQEDDQPGVSRFLFHVSSIPLANSKRRDKIRGGRKKGLSIKETKR
jgi:hypothetical protein